MISVIVVMVVCVVNSLIDFGSFVFQLENAIRCADVNYTRIELVNSY